MSFSSSLSPMEIDSSNNNHNNKNNNHNNNNMEIDPVDGGPRPTPPSSPMPQHLSMQQLQQQKNVHVIPPPTTTVLSKEDEARQTIELLRHANVSYRVSAAHKLDTAATVLGPERTRNELLPYVTEGIDDEDEVLLALAQSLGRMVELVGGPLYAHLLLPPLELLLTVEETAVRDVASNSAQFVAKQLPPETFQSQYADMLARLAQKEWFTARISAAGLIAAAYPQFRTVTLQRDHVTYFTRLCKDDTPMVRRVAAQYLGTMVKHVYQVLGRPALDETGVVVTSFIPLFEEFASTEQPDSVRLQTTANCVAFGEVMRRIIIAQQKEEPPNELQQQGGGSGGGAGGVLLRPCEMGLLHRILPLVVATIDDRSWRVRWTAAAKFAQVVAAYDELPDTMDALVPAYEKLLQDPEAEVRTAATFNLAHVAQCRSRVPLSPLPLNRPPQDGGGADHHPQDAYLAGPRVSVAVRLVKKVTTLTEDDSEHVRAALAMVATELAPVLGKEATITYLVPPVLLLLRDAASEVRLNLISSLAALNEVIGVDLLSQSLLPAILDLAKDGKWRIRIAIIQHIPLLAEQLGRDFFTEKLASMCVGWLGDDIATIRHAAARNMGKLTALFGTEWAIQFLLPAIVDIRLHESYLRRLTALQACAVMATNMTPDAARIHVLPLVLAMASDVVPNIRFNVAKELQTMTPICGIAAYESQVVPVLNLLLDDDDRDVRFYAEKTMSVLEDFFFVVADEGESAPQQPSAAAAVGGGPGS